MSVVFHAIGIGMQLITLCDYAVRQQFCLRSCMSFSRSMGPVRVDVRVAASQTSPQMMTPTRQRVMM